ncbi:hypothetical protein NLG97_g9976 [Lecanicillium saksenae]|uniref:Uncharacterized protein n=1 Tax=Lecanicillium saksenae TaxID=468837 RepID=A0ACC1QEH5_9HYPO|nr:hypothetical protein NLG97_g9976 [Lecanicillium saksenae]
MGLKVMPAGEKDVARSVVIENAAYGRNPISHIIFPGPFENNADAAREEAMVKNLRADPESCLWIQAVDEDRIAQGEHGMVCFSMGYLWESTPVPPPKRAWGPGSNPEACELFFGTMTDKWFNRLGSKPHFYLKLLHTDPAHQRRGAGSMLLQHFADEADKRGLESYLEASDEGRPLYEKFGYETVEVMVTDFSKWGGMDKYETCLMLRKPKTASQ